MLLISAASPGMRAAHTHKNVRTIVSILIQDRNLLRPAASFLKKYSSCDQRGFEEGLAALRLFRSRPTDNGVTMPDYVITLTETLSNLYQQKDINTVRYQRGAIVEALVHQLIHHRYNKPGELCLTNQRFKKNSYTDITIQEVDVAALSNIRCKVEGYECKVNPAAFEEYDGLNLDDLAKAAKNLQYRGNVGFVAFENDQLMRIKVTKLQLPASINLYGLDSIEKLHNIPSLED